MIGTTLSHYQITAKLGEGGMGEVYRATDTRLSRDVALKVLPTELADEAERLARFEREAKTVAALNHPNIVTLHSVEEAGGVHFLTMELVEGETLDRHVPPGGASLARLFELAIPLADALAEAHARGITHRDLKPANVMVTERGQVKVLDFGLAKLAAGGEEDGDETLALTRDGLILGTVHYMSPEQAMGRPADHRSDVFSFGVLLYEMTTGRRPFQGDSSAELMSSILRDDPPPITEVKPDLPKQLSRVVRRCLQKVAEKRYQTALGIRNELEDLKNEIDASSSRVVADQGSGRRSRRALPAWLWAAFGVALVIAGGLWLARDRGAGESGPPAAAAGLEELLGLVEDEQYPRAFMIARGLEPGVAADPSVLDALERSSQSVSIDAPPGAEIAIRPYGDDRWPWLALGTTPIESVRAPRGFVRVRIVREGQAPYEIATELEERSAWEVPAEPMPAGMTWVPGGTASASSLSPALPSEPVEVPGFYIDRFEVTNEEFSRFVRDGGYRRPELWPAFARDGSTLSWEQAAGELVDETGRPGPAGWELGTFVEGTGRLPVTGVSWFEAAAYAAWAGKQLPTLYHWLRAAELWASPHVVPNSNFGGRLLPVGGDRGLGVWGTRDLAGNAGEWSRSATTDGGRLLLGGAWSQHSYSYFTSYEERSAWERPPELGFRCMRETGGAEAASPAAGAIRIRPSRDLLAEVPADDAAFEIYRSFHDFEQRPLDPRAESEEQVSAHWTLERVSIDAGHGAQRLPVLFLRPAAGGRPPYQTAVLFGGANALGLSSSEDVSALVSFDAVDFLLRGGRAVAIPILLGTYERQDGFDLFADDPIVFRDHILAWSKEVRRTVDYLETREDVDADRIFYVGSSLGSGIAPVVLALEPRFSAAYLRLAGLMSWRLPGEVEPLNFAPRVQVPVLMINGRYDRLLPLESAQRGLLRWLGTPEDHKKMVLFDVGHAPPRPRNRVIREVLTWADQVLGPVEPEDPAGGGE